MDLSVVVPVCNESENIEPLVAEIRAALDGRLDYEIVYVDDGSTDETPRRLEALLRQTSRLRCLRHQERCGQSAAIHTGVKAARAPWIATLDGDGQNDPGDILRLLEVIARPDRPPRLELVAGIRRRRHDNWLRRASSRIANAVRSRALKDNVTDTGCGLKLIHRDAFLALPFFDHMHRFLPALIARGGGAVLTAGVSHRHRTQGRSKYGVYNRLWVGIVDLLGVRWLQRRMKIPAATEVRAEAATVAAPARVLDAEPG